MQICKLAASLAATAMLGFAVSASAGTFQGTTSGVFGTPTGNPGDPIVYHGVGTNHIYSGTSVDANPENNLLYNGVGFDTDAGSAGSPVPFEVGSLDYYNGATVSGTSATHFPIDVSLAFTAPPGQATQVFNFAFDLTLTPNTGGPGDADIINFPTSFSGQSFTYNNQDYTLKLLGFSNDGGATILNSFTLPENQQTSTGLFATLTTETNPNIVPLPAAASMGMSLLGGIGGFTLLRKRRQLA